MSSSCCSTWQDACIAAAILAADPDGVVGVTVRSAAGPVRDRWLAMLQQLMPRRSPVCKIPLHVADGRLLGGLDLAATLKAGRPVAERGILAQADGGTVLLAMAERMSAGLAGKLTSVIDTRAVMLERDGFAERIPARFAVVALDEGIEPDERPPAGLLERLGLHLDLNAVPLSAAAGSSRAGSEILQARSRLGSVHVSDELMTALCEAATALGIGSARAHFLALRVARASAALAGRATATEEDAALAARLVFASRATRAPAQPEERTQAQGDSHEGTAEAPAEAASPADQPGEEPDRQPQSSQPPQSLTERVVEAARAAISADMLAHLDRLSAHLSQSRGAGRSAGEHLCTRGRPAGIRCGDPRRGARISVIDTLRAAAPWQKLRRAVAQKSRGRQPTEAGESRVRVKREDFRVLRFKRRNQLTTIFLVDASGSAALNRLAEVKGAVELMLAESYVRRDRVALISFRGSSAQMLLPPTTSLVRAKRELASLPGGGGTPMAKGLDAARSLADSLSRRGESPVIVVLTDGRPNVTRDGKGNRVQAEADTMHAARMLRSSSIASLMVDTAPQPRPLTERVAHEMGARYVPLPHVEANMLAGVVRQCTADRAGAAHWRAHA